MILRLVGGQRDSKRSKGSGVSFSSCPCTPQNTDRRIGPGGSKPVMYMDLAASGPPGLRSHLSTRYVGSVTSCERKEMKRKRNHRKDTIKPAKEALRGDHPEKQKNNTLKINKTKRLRPARPHLTSQGGVTVERGRKPTPARGLCRAKVV